MNQLLQQTQDKIAESVNPPELRQAVEKVVEAGKKIMYSEQTRDLLIDQLNSEGDLPEVVGSGIAKLAAILFSEYKRTLPMEVLMPSAFLLMVESLDFLEKAGQAEITNDFVAKCTEEVGSAILQAIGVTPEQLAAAQNGQPISPGAAQAPATAEPTQPAAPAQPPPGIVSGAMGGM